ncbi:MAG: hybrid sensor histidine kinase/response regulator, partial [Psychrobacter alimentarius]
MKNQPNNIVTLEWLLPLFNQQLSQISDGWQSGTDDINQDQIVESYHQVSGALTMARLPLLANLASHLGLLAQSIGHEGLSTYHSRIGQFSHKLLQRELNQYSHTGSYHSDLIQKTVEGLAQTLSKLGITTNLPLHFIGSQYEKAYSHLIEDTIFDSIEAIIPTNSMTADLTDHHYQQLLLVWRKQVQTLLLTNTNQPSLLAVLEKVSQYLWQTTQNREVKHLWYLTEIWLRDLARNNTPLPEHYAALLNQLEQAIAPFNQHSDEVLSNFIKNLIINVYIELSGLTTSSERTQSVLSHLSQNTSTASRFLPRILSALETLIFNLDEPQTLLPSLQKIKHQLEGRGWTYYGLQVETLITEIEQALSSETGF